MPLSVFLKNLVRLKTVNLAPDGAPLKRCLSTLDLTLLGIASMVGVTLYILTGVVAKDTAGPSVVLSYVLASTAALFAGMCYAELGSIFTRTGSAYLFTYSTIGELPAFIAGWSIILEYLLSSAIIARGWSGYLDSMLDSRIQNFTVRFLMGGEPWNTPYVAPFPDLVAGLLLTLFVVIVAIGVKVSANCNKVLVVVNFTVVVFTTVGGFLFADSRNWSDHGFFPFGFEGTITGAAIVFIGFVGFDVITVSSEEALNVQKGVPRAVITAIVVVAAMYVLVAMDLTLAVPYSEIHMRAALASVFDFHGVHWAKYIVDVGALCSMSACMLASVYALPRIVYALSTDGLFFSVFSRVNSTTQTPLVATVCFGAVSGLLSIFFDLPVLVSVLSIGTLTAFILVSASVMMIRYKPSHLTRHIQQMAANSGDVDSEWDEDGGSDKASFLHAQEDRPIVGGRLKPKFQFLTAIGHYGPGTVPSVCFLVTTCLQFAVVFIVVVYLDNIKAGDWWAILLVIVLGTSAVLIILPITFHEQVDTGSAFRAPFVPLTPMLSILCNIILIMLLPTDTWIRFAIWIGVGMVIYFLYGYSHSTEGLAVKTISFSREHYTSLKTDNEDANQCVLEGSLIMPQPAKKEKENLD